MKDIAPDLYDSIMKSFMDKYIKARGESNSAISRTLEKLGEGTATFKDADLSAIELSRMLSGSLGDVLKLEDMPDGILYYNIADKTLGVSASEVYGMAADIAADVMDSINNRSGFKIKAVTAQVNKDRLNGLVSAASEAKEQSTLSRILNEYVENFVMSAVDDTVKSNAEFQYKAGLQPVIKREGTGKCCEWCGSLEGVYKYPDEVPADVFKRHRGCQCVVEFVRADKGYQNVWSKKWSDRSQSDGQRAERIRFEQNIIKDMRSGRNDRIEFAENLKKRAYRNSHIAK